MSIPVLYYHSIADHEVEHPWAFLSCPIAVFKRQMKWLLDHKYNTCTWRELHDHTAGIKLQQSKTVHIQFDDGFLDNWSVVFPIMEKYNLKYTVVITPEFVEDSQIVRPYLSSTTEANKSDWWGYLSKGEISKMVASGLVDFQAHGYTHTWYAASSTVVDIIDEASFYPHIYWNTEKDSKPHWLLESELNKNHLNRLVFEYRKSLELDSRFLYDENAVQHIERSIDHSLSKSEQVIQANTLIEANRDKVGRYESDEEKKQRLLEELKLTRETILSITDMPCDYLVFPGGGNTTEVIDLCKEVGYKQVSKGKNLNKANSDVYQISRMTGYHNFGGGIKNLCGNLLLLRLQVMRGSGSILVANSISVVKWIKRLIK